MKKIALMLFTLLLVQPALAAKKKKYWYKVESEKTQKKSENNPSYPYDSLESQNKSKVFREVGFWPNQTNVAVGGGLYADETVYKDDKYNRFFISSHIGFRNRSWHRVVAGGLLIQNNTFILDASWHYLPSRKRRRQYYGFGIAHSIYSNDEFRSVLKTSNYFATATYGMEFLQPKQRGYRGEVKGYLGSGGTIVVHFLFSYIFHL